MENPEQLARDKRGGCCPRVQYKEYSAVTKSDGLLVSGEQSSVKISIFGLGYVGTVSAGCLAHDGHRVIGVDPSQTKVDLINSSQSPIIEAGIGEIIASSAKAGRLCATGDPAQAIRQTDLSFVCVGTPSLPN